jgi:hypothetical protein
MRALLLTLLAVAWLEDGLLRRFVDARLSRPAATGLPWFLLSGAAILMAALAGPRFGLLPAALAVAMTGFTLAPGTRDAAPPTPARERLRRLREAAPLAAGLIAAAALLAVGGDATARQLAAVAVAVLLLSLARGAFPALQARLAASRLAPGWLAVPAPLLLAFALALSVTGLSPP